MRAAVIIIRGGDVALIRRTRSGELYYLFPGGGVEVGETPEEAAIREAYEELGLEVRLEGLAAVVAFDGNEQRYYLATVVGGEFGTGSGEELSLSPDSPAGGYVPVWLRMGDLRGLDVRPKALAEAISSGAFINDCSAPLTIVESRNGEAR